MKSYKLIVAYDGSQYCGWQVQKKGKRSIAQALNDSFFSVFKKKVRVLGASRTDAGVHALGQVVKVVTDLPLESKKLQWAWNNILPSDIKIRSLECDNFFNPFHNVQQKIYYYHFFLERPLPFMHHYGYFYPYKINIEQLKEALQIFVGTHDFASFRSSEDTRENTTRTIDNITLEYFKRYKVYRITIKGQKFLRHMIRRIIGATLSAVSFHENYKEKLQEILVAKNPSHSLPNAPAKGLLLYKIIYKQ